MEFSRQEYGSGLPFLCNTSPPNVALEFFFFFFFNAQRLGFRNSSETQQERPVPALLCLKPQLKRLKSWGLESSVWQWAGALGSG